jgi:hypothetical protein
MNTSRFAWTCLAVAIGACAADPAPDQPTYLPSDAYFLKPEVPSCVASTPDPYSKGYPCCQVLRFDSIGDASKESGEEGFPGHYHLEGDIAVGVLFGQAFEFDFSTNIATGQPLIAGPWIADPTNLQAVACLP